MEAIRMSEALKQIQEESFQKGFQQGFQEGFKQGLQLGRQLALRMVVKNMLRLNQSIPFIAQVTDLSEQEIQKIKEALNA
ncbi:hypothetical protein [Eubacterium limosum]|uniref:hypothetical protein n=1 Tax=Eubacterium limosum TaxID=1736 RepID=UPI00371A7D38